MKNGTYCGRYEALVPDCVLQWPMSAVDTQYNKGHTIHQACKNAARAILKKITQSYIIVTSASYKYGRKMSFSSLEMLRCQAARLFLMRKMSDASHVTCWTIE
jgi:hypothetical protein